MQIDVLTLFPEMIEGASQHSMMKRAQDKDLLAIDIINFRQYGLGKHSQVDDTPYGGGAGMLLKPEPIFHAMEAIHQKNPGPKKVLLMDPAGQPFNQEKALELSKEDHLVFICGHYEGYDERIRELVDEEVSLGDFVLTGGELAANVIMDATVRLIPGVLGNHDSAVEDSHSTGLLEHPHYTRPQIFQGMEVPSVLRNGNHQLIEAWRRQESLRRTFDRRPDMLDQADLTEADRKFLRQLTEQTNKENL